MTAGASIERLRRRRRTSTASSRSKRRRSPTRGRARCSCASCRTPTSSRVYVAARRRRPVAGFCSFWLVLDELHINNLAVAAAIARPGASRRALLRAVLAEAPATGATRATLEVRRSNDGGAAAVRTARLRVAGDRGRTTTHNPVEDALILWRENWLRIAIGRTALKRGDVLCYRSADMSCSASDESTSQGGGNADRLRRAEAPAAADRRGVPPARHPASRPRRSPARPHRPRTTSRNPNSSKKSPSRSASCS